MQLITKEQREQLLRNGRKTASSATTYPEMVIDHKPVVKLFTPDAQCTWLLSELDPERPDSAFGLCDLGMGFPELGTVSLTELRGVRGALGLPIERDLGFEAAYSLSGYVDAAVEQRGIIA